VPEPEAQPGEDDAAGPEACGPLGGTVANTAAGAAWDWASQLIAVPQDLPLHALMLSATRLLGAYGQQTVQATGLKASLAGLGVLRVLIASDGLKSTEVADRALTTPGTMTAVVNTLVRDGFVERRPDPADRRITRLYITDAGRALIEYYVSQTSQRWRDAFDFVDEADEAVVRKFFLQLIDHLSQLTREERGK
jgi:DNA-binding MarR family transcriptional regulator